MPEIESRRNLERPSRNDQGEITTKKTVPPAPWGKGRGDAPPIVGSLQDS